ncbi:UNVERIFIED_CONTAM: hypothetical protein Sradi_7134800 [Sesamum radiatum]|uniref:Aminotransferase-like plant mobile domain-containing protein n=1 Tax=Sesamum radiatum TaxID=300843 RepID=A0AAW2IZS1_SESRA
MVYFKDKSSPSGEHHLIILDDQHQSVEKGTVLAVYAPLVGGRSIVEGDAKWDGDPQFTGEFHYTKEYWEWTEDVLSRCGKRLRLINAYDAVYALLFTYDHNFDIIKEFCEAGCLLTNTLLISAGELPISLCDLHDLAGLSVTGCLYDEVIPSAIELTGADEKGGRCIPRSSKYLLYACHLLQGADDDRCSNVPIDKWVKFWSKKVIKYHLPPPRKEKKMVRPKSTHNPLGDITTHKRWSIAEEALFEKLCIEGNLKEEVYLAAYLACWLCTFVLPGKDINSIPPSTFKMASTMANGRRVSLAILVLTSIYEGLNTIATSSKPARTSLSFPVHFVYAWLASYFKTHYPFWQGLCGLKMTIFSGEGGTKPFKFVDNGDAEEFDHNYFIAIRSSYLTLRLSDKFILSPTALIDLGVNLEAYKAWWAKVYGTFLEDNIACLISPRPPNIILKRKKFRDNQVDGGENNPSPVLVPRIVVKSNSQAKVVKKEKLEDEVQSIDASEESDTSHSSTMTPPLGMEKGKQLPHLPAVSVFEGESFIFNHRKEFLQKLWSGLLVKISNTPVDFLSSIEDDVYLIFESMKSFQKFDITKVEESLNTCFVKVSAYDEARSLSSHKLSRSLHGQHLKEAEDRLQDVQAKASEGASKAQYIIHELEHVEKEIVVLKGRRTSLCVALKGQKQLNHDVQAKVNEVKENVAALKNTAPLDDAIVEDLESSKAKLGDLKEDLKSLNPFA